MTRNGNGGTQLNTEGATMAERAISSQSHENEDK